MFNLPQHDFNPVPTPTLTPTEVVCLQLDALQNNDLMPADEGIRMAYRFASPAVKGFIRGYENFLHLLKANPLYRPMIGFERAELGTPAYNLFGDQVRQRVWLHRRGGAAVYNYVLSKQTIEPYTGCWMVDAVIREA